MYQTHASAAADLPPAARPRGDGPSNGPSVGLYLDVEDLDAVAAAMGDVAPVVPRRRTFYGADEIGWREPVGHLVLFSRHAPAAPPAAGDAG